MRTLIQLLLLGLLLPSCSIFKSRQKRSGSKIQSEVAQSPVFAQAFTGFTLLDPATGKTLADYQGDRYFTPASNVKILTLATCLEVLGDSVPGMQVVATDEVLIFRGTGDPTFLHPDFEAWQKARRILYRPAVPLLCFHRRFEEGRFGPGWAWDDYNEGYQVEKSALPIYGNCFEVTGRANQKFHVEPTFFDRFYRPGRERKASIGVQRMELDNIWTFDSIPDQTVEKIPFRPNMRQFSAFEDASPTTLLGELLSDTLKRPVSEHFWDVETFTESNDYPWKTLYSTPIDTVLRRMMHQSDNFIAEQMLLVCAGQKFEVLEQDTLIQWMLDSVLQQLPQRPKWKDGSGLSRYNLATPQSLAQVLLKLWNTHPKDRLLSFFPAGGVDGTLSGWYAGKDGKPYVFAKTGSMGSVYCLSGFVVCKSGKVLIFSFMNNHFVGSSKAWKLEIQRVLGAIHDQF